MTKLLGGIWSIAVLYVLAIALLVATAVFTGSWLTDKRTAKARIEAPSKAKEYAADILSYDYRALEADLGKAKGHMTSSMAGKYDRFYRKAVVPYAPTVKAVMRSEVQATGVVKAAPDQVEVLLFVNSVSINSRSKEPRLDLNRTRFVMKRVDGRWLVDQAGFAEAGLNPTP